MPQESHKVDFAPLLAPGRHITTMDALKAMCVDPFDGQSRERRIQLFEALGELFVKLIGLGIPCNLFVDGSFLTKKPFPSDIDVMVCLDHSVVQSLTAEQFDFYMSLNSTETQVAADVDSKAFTAYPRGHNQYGKLLYGCGSVAPAAHYGLENGEYYLKGYAVLVLLETDVGNLIGR
jgi:hypothetical protein